jgi:hypothetical protein
VNHLSLNKEKELLLSHSIQIYRLIDEALRKGVKVAVCSTSNEKAVSKPACCAWNFFLKNAEELRFIILRRLKPGYRAPIQYTPQPSMLHLEMVLQIICSSGANRLLA